MIESWVGNFTSNLFSDAIVVSILGIIAYRWIENKSKLKESEENKKRLLENLIGDLEYNLSVNKEVERVFKEYIINVAHYIYATDGIRDFVYKKAFNKPDDFYNKLFKLLVLLESSNKLLKAALFRVDNGQHAIVENSIRSNTTDIGKILKRVTKEIDGGKN